MPSRPKFDLSRLREIGWSKWDPIGLDDDWRSAAPDEYDTYLMRAAGMLFRGQPEEEAASYLLYIETDYMGLSRSNPHAAAETVAALKAYVHV